MSNLTDVIAAMAAIGSGDAAVIDLVGTAFGLFADLGGAIDLESTVVSWVEGNSGGPSNQDIYNAIQQLNTTVANGLASINAHLTATDILNLSNGVANTLTQLEGQVSEIPTYVTPAYKASPQYDPTGLQSECYTWALQLLTDPRWELPAGDVPSFQPTNPWAYLGTQRLGEVFTYEVFRYIDGTLIKLNVFDTNGPNGAADPRTFNWTNDFTPPGAGGGLLFNYDYVLAAALKGVLDYLLVCAAVVPAFPNDPSSPGQMSTLAGRLRNYHDKIVQSIVNIAPPHVDADVKPTSGGQWPDELAASSSANGISWWQVATVASSVYPPGGGSNQIPPSLDPPYPPTDWARPYGALCALNAFVANAGSTDPKAPPSVDSYPDYTIDYTPNPGFQPYPLPQSRAIGS